MLRNVLRWSLILAACVFAGCGGASGIQSGIPADANTTPVNPTPDMGPSTTKPKT